MVTLESNMRLFRRLDAAFWGVWLLLPVTIWIQVHSILDVNGLREMVQPSQAACLDILPVAVNLSKNGSILHWTLYATAYCFFIGMLAVVHQAIRRFARGNVFVADTLSSFNRIGLLIVGWSIYESVMSNLLNYGLSLSGDLQSFRPDYNFDIVVFAIGSFIMAFKFILQRAILLQEEADLTV